MFNTYILRCADDSLYVGHCEDLDARLACHRRGDAAAWTASRRPVTLIYSKPFRTRAEAVAREQQLKRWSRAKKIALIERDTARLRESAKRRT